MSKDLTQKFDKVPRDGHHFTPEELMEEALKENLNPSPHREKVWEATNQISGNATMTVGGGGSMSFNYCDTDGVKRVHNLDVAGGWINAGLTLNTNPSMPLYEIDPELIQDMEDVKAIFRAMDKKLKSFYTREDVRGIEHLVKKL